MREIVKEGIKPHPGTVVRRHPERAAYDRGTIRAILDEGFLCHVATAVGGRVRVIPMLYGRDKDTLYLHGSPASALLGDLRRGVKACLSVALVDGFVLARSIKHHSMNYRSVVAFGRTRAVTGDGAKRRALRVLSEHLLPGRWREARPPSAAELRSTEVLAFPLSEVSAKVRSGGPLDLESDLGLPVWAGAVPLRLAAGRPVADPRSRKGLSFPRRVLRRFRVKARR